MHKGSLKWALLGTPGKEGLAGFYQSVLSQFPPTVIATAVAFRLRAIDCRLRGWVLVDYPRTAADATALAAQGIVPSTVVALVPTNWPSGDLLYGTEQQQPTHTPVPVPVPVPSELPKTEELPYRCAMNQLESVCTYFSTHHSDVMCRLSVFEADLSLKEGQQYHVHQRAFTFNRTHPFAASMSPYYQLLQQRLSSKLYRRRQIAGRFKYVFSLRMLDF